MTLLMSFLTGAGTDAAGRTHAEIIAMTNEELEQHHDFIQWVFPFPEPSRAVPHSPVLTPQELTILRASDQAHLRILAAAERMLRFYAATHGWLAGYDHNHLRITRIIRSLRLIVGNEPANSFRTAILARVKEVGAAIPDATIAYWGAA